MKSKALLAAILVVTMALSQVSAVLAVDSEVEGEVIPGSKVQQEESSFIKAEVVHIPDENLKKVLKEMLGVNEDVEITVSKLESLTGNLDISYIDVESLEGLQYCKNLTSIAANYNRIGDISPLSGLSNLTELSLEHNNISDISILRELNLTYLSLGGNPIENLEVVSELTQLNHLCLDNLNLNNDDLKMILSLDLWILSLNNNNITDFSILNSLPGLGYLELKGNKITKLPEFTNLKELYRINLNNNSISDISELSSLEKADYIGVENQRIVLDKVEPKDEKIITNNPIVGTGGDISITNITNNGVYDTEANTITWDEWNWLEESFNFAQHNWNSSSGANIKFHGKVIQKIDFEDKSEVVNIVDKNLEGIIRDKLSLAPETPITAGLLGTLKGDLDISSSDIKSLEGLQYCKNLISLNANYNNISDLSPLKDLKKLQYVEAYDQQVHPLAVIASDKSIAVNPVKDINGDSVTPRDITLNGEYDAEDNTISWEKVSSLDVAEYSFHTQLHSDTMKVNFSGTVYQEFIHNDVPVILGAENITINEGDSFDPLKGIIAEDETGDLTAKIVVEGNVDTEKPGSYTLIYKVTNSIGNTATIKRVVTVKAKEDTGSGSGSGNESGDGSGSEAGDGSGNEAGNENSSSSQPDLSGNDKLPQTGSAIPNIINILGLGSIVAGLRIRRKRK